MVFLQTPKCERPSARSDNAPTHSLDCTARSSTYQDEQAAKETNRVQKISVES
jgi:hypothetical protein